MMVARLESVPYWRNFCLGLFLISAANTGGGAEAQLATGQLARANGAKPLAAVLTPEKWKQVENAVDRGLTYLISRQEPDGSFATIPSGQPGVTSLCVMPFLSRGLEHG